MGIKSLVALILAFIAAFLYLCAFVTPWWFFKFSGHGNPRTNCFIDGTCRNSGVVFKNNGDAQDIWDAVIIMMALSTVPFLIFLHYLLFQRSHRYHFLPARRIITLISALLAFLLIGASVITFAVGLRKVNHC
jgi:hypothetical protein